MAINILFSFVGRLTPHIKFQAHKFCLIRTVKTITMVFALDISAQLAQIDKNFKFTSHKAAEKLRKKQNEQNEREHPNEFRTVFRPTLIRNNDTGTYTYPHSRKTPSLFIDTIDIHSMHLIHYRKLVSYSPLVLLMAKNPSGLPDVMRYVIFCCGSLSPSSAINCNTFTPAGLLSLTVG